MSKPHNSGWQSPREPINRYFFAVVPRAEAVGVIDWLAHYLRRLHRFHGRTIGPARYHISLCGVGAPGEAPKDIVSLLKGIGDQIRSGPFAVGFDHAVSFGNDAARRPLVLAHSDSMPALERLQGNLWQAMAAVGLRTKRQFRPHLTLLYDEAAIAETGILPLRWIVRDFVLVRSVHGESRHEHIARWPLDGGRGARMA